MKKMKRIAAMTVALLICSGVMGYMPEGALKIGDFAANATGKAIAESVEINETNFPDAIFRQYVTENIDKDNDGVLSTEEIITVTNIDVSNKGISDLTGIEYFTNLEDLHCNYNKLKVLDVSNNTALRSLSCCDNQLTSLDVSNNKDLYNLICFNNQLTTLDVSNNTALKYFHCNSNQLTTLDVSKNVKLETLSCSLNHFTTLDVSNNTALKELECKNNTYEIDLSDKIDLTECTIDLSAISADFDVTKASDWANGTVEGNILKVKDITMDITYTYDCGNGKTGTFTLNPIANMSCLSGDVTGDGSIDSNDATLILSDYAELAVGNKTSLTFRQAYAADVNNDFKYDAIDASLILAYYAYIQTGGTDSLSNFLNS